MRYVNDDTFIMPAYFRDRKMWYKDSFVIAENYRVDIETGADGETTWETRIYQYTFVDMKNQSFYIYSGFSDTASLLQQYVQPDTGRVEGGWNFFEKKRQFMFDNKRPLPDTIIDGISYKRIIADGIKQNDPQNPGLKVTQVAYLRCDKKGSFFYIDFLLSQAIGCPVVRYDVIGQEGIWIKIEVEFLPDKLTPAEIKVFDAWGKYARENPVSR